MRNKCSVDGCKSKDVKYFKFPRNIERAEIWRAFCCSEELFNKPIDKLHNHHCICERHFSRDQFTNCTMSRLNLNSAPSLLSPCQRTHSSFPSIQAHTENLPVSEPHSNSQVNSTSLPPVPQNLGLADFSETNTLHSRGSVSENIPSDAGPSGIELERQKGANTATTSKKYYTCSLLKDLNITQDEMTPRKKSLFREVQEQKKETRRLKKITRKLKDERLLDKKSAANIITNNLEKCLSPAGFSLVSAVLNEVKKKPKGRRWSMSAKIVALSLLKQGPKTYKCLSTIFPMPSKNTLLPLLQCIPFSTGINKDSMKQLSDAIAQFRRENRVCTLIFDEMAIRPQLSYNVKSDQILGFVDHGHLGRSPSIAKQALVFMVRGVAGNWKQPVAYFFSGAATKAETLAVLMNEVLMSLKSIGLRVVATVCDMGRNNVKALQILGASYSEPYFKFENTRVLTIFDPPHLLKCFRNLFLKYNILVDVQLGGESVPLLGKWSHIKDLVENSASSPFDPISRLTEKHLAPNGFQKMRVSLAAEVCSRTVANGIETMVAKNKLGIDALATSEVILEVDRLFDSLNADSQNRSNKKVLKHPVTDTSMHQKYWDSVIPKIGKWEYRGDGGKVIHPPSQKGWVATLKAVGMLWETLRELNFRSLNTRNVNQDPIENLFCVVRQNCGGNHHPNAEQFISALKTAVINSLFTCKSQGNTAPDNCTIASNLHSLFYVDFDSGYTKIMTNTTTLCDVKIKNKNLNNIPHVAGIIAEATLKNVDCLLCRADVYASLDSNIFMSNFCQDESGSLLPSDGLIEAVSQGTNAIKKEISKFAHECNLSSLCRPLACNAMDLTFLKCSEHRETTREKIEAMVLQVGVKQFCISCDK